MPFNETAILCASQTYRITALCSTSIGMRLKTKVFRCFAAAVVRVSLELNYIAPFYAILITAHSFHRMLNERVPLAAEQLPFARLIDI